MLQTILLIANLFLLETMLSVDNAAVLAVLVKDLPKEDSVKALRWGIMGAYVFRGLLLFFASFLAGFWPIKLAGGIYLLYLYIQYIRTSDKNEGAPAKEASAIYKWANTHLGISHLWSTIILVEFTDLAFSIDNILASVALSQSWWIICLGVFMGIAAMRFIAGWFVKLMERYPSLEGSAYIVILLLGIRLVLSGALCKVTWFMELLDSKAFSAAFSATTMLIFFFPILRGLSKSSEKQPL